MLKRVIYSLMVLFIGSFIFFYSCNESPVYNEQSSINMTDAGTNISVPNVFCGTGTLQIPNGFTPQQIGDPIQLWAGVGNPQSGVFVGIVSFVVSGSNLQVTYNFTDIDQNGIVDFFPYVPTSIHFDIADKKKELHVNKSGNPVPGQFDYVYDVPAPYAITNHTFTIPIPTDTDNDGYYIAAHASIVQFGGVEGFNFYLPNNQVTLRIVDYPSQGDPSYFRLQVTNGGFISTYNMGYGPGIYEGWCIDVDHTINLNQNYPALLFSSYEDLPSWLVGNGMIEYPQNFDKINYLINTFATGQMVQPKEANCNPRMVNGIPVPPEALTYSDIQRAIWYYIDNNQSSNGLSNWSQYRVNAIICAVEASGEGFVPACNQKIVFIVVPYLNGGYTSVQIVIGQPVIGEIQVPCATQGQTCWADGKYGANFDKAKQWGTWFRYNKMCP